MPIYLDHNANSPTTTAATTALVTALESGATNPSSGHGLAARAREFVDDARRSIARCTGARPSEVRFTSGGTESDNIALKGLFAARAPRRRVLVVATEHHAVLQSADAIALSGAEIVRLPVGSDGLLRFDALEAELDADTALVAVMLANNETGVIQDVARVARAAAKHGVPVHTDAVQALGKIPVSFSELGVVTGAFTGHKLGAPIGIGGLFVRKGTAVTAQTHGGGQESGLRPGSTPFALIHSLASAVGEACAKLSTMDEGVRRLRDQFERRLAELRPDALFHGAAVDRLPNTSLVTIPGIDGPQTMLDLDARGIRVGTGAACATGEPSHVLMAMGYTPEQAHATLRFSLGVDTTATEIDEVLRVLGVLIGG